MKAIGLDGFSRGWVAVCLEGDARELSFHPDITEALRGPFDRAGIDIPIGMTGNGERACDRLAREKLRPHASRVFTGSRRWLWQEFSDPDQANREALRRGQARVSRQLWHLGRKIMEVDAFVRAHRELDVREVHPELVFWRLNGGKPLPPKKSEEGDALRRRLLKRHGFARDRPLAHRDADRHWRKARRCAGCLRGGDCGTRTRRQRPRRIAAIGWCRIADADLVLIFESELEN